MLRDPENPPLPHLSPPLPFRGCLHILPALTHLLASRDVGRLWASPRSVPAQSSLLMLTRPPSLRGPSSLSPAHAQAVWVTCGNEQKASLLVSEFATRESRAGSSVLSVLGVPRDRRRQAPSVCLALSMAGTSTPPPQLETLIMLVSKFPDPRSSSPVC